MTHKGQPVAAPLDRCLAVAATLPIPDGTSGRDRDVLFAVIGRRLTRRSMPEIEREYGLSKGYARTIAVKVMRRQGVKGLAWYEEGYGDMPKELWPVRMALLRGLERLPRPALDDSLKRDSSAVFCYNGSLN